MFTFVIMVGNNILHCVSVVMTVVTTVVTVPRKELFH